MPYIDYYLTADEVELTKDGLRQAESFDFFSTLFYFMHLKFPI